MRAFGLSLDFSHAIPLLRIGSATVPNPPLSAWRVQTGAASGSLGRSREAARRRRPLRLRPSGHYCQQQKEGWQPPTSPDLIAVTFRPPCDGIGDPAVDVGLMPT